MKNPHTINTSLAILLTLTTVPLILNQKHTVSDSEPPMKQDSVETTSLRAIQVDSLRLSNCQAVQVLFEKLAYDELDTAIPEVYLQNINKSFKELTIEERKRTFVQMLVPLALKANEKVVFEKARITLLDEVEDSLELESYFIKYRASSKKELLEKVNVVPIPLLLAQSILESGWGTSRFTVEGCALFGQHSYANSDVVLNAKNSAVKMKCFKNLQASVDAYILNLNRHRAYRFFRAERLKMLNSGKVLDAELLASYLNSYSERGSKYIRSTIAIMASNNLERYQGATLKRAKRTYVRLED